MAGDLSKTPEFRDETELQDTGQDGLQRFKKPLLHPAELLYGRSPADRSG
jgi:hypothetical protein